jgi:tRNA(fMet)-specific endonuclease VapC
MPRVFVDTDILSEYLKKIDENVVQRGDAYAQEHTQFTFSSVTVYEIIRGLEEKGASGQVKKALSSLRLNEEILPTSEDYLTAAHVNAKARRSGRTVELPDCLIAASAARLGITLVTGNTDDFSVIKNTGLNLTLENWRDT